MTRFNKLLIALGIILLIALIINPFGKKEAESSPENLIVGLQSGYPPFEFTNESGQIIGFDVDVAQLLAQHLNKTLVIKDMDFDSLIISLQQGKIDLILSGMNITPTREKEIDLIPYHGADATQLSLIFWNTPPSDIQSLEDFEKLPDASISVESGTVPEAYLSLFPNIKVKTFQGALAPLMDVKFGKSLATLVEPDVATYLKNTHPEIVILPIQLKPEAHVGGFGIGIKKGNTALYDQVKKAVEKIKSSGELQSLENKWFKTSK